MSDFSNLFSQHQRKHAPPIKRLFGSTEQKQKEERSIEPKKSIFKGQTRSTVNRGEHVLSQADLPKKYLQKDGMAREIDTYNQSVLVSYFRKMFFVTVVLVVGAYLTNCHNHHTLLLNLMLTAALLECPLAYDPFDTPLTSFFRTSFALLSYYLAFASILQELNDMHFKDETAIRIRVIALWGCLNFALMHIFRPLLLMRAIINTRKPYRGIFNRTKRVVILYLNTLRAIFHFFRLFLLGNIVFWLAVIIYIVYSQNQLLFQTLFSVKTIKMTFFTAFLLYNFEFCVQILNESMGASMMQPIHRQNGAIFKHRQISVGLLRLSQQNSNNGQVQGQVIKYVWNNCEQFWDTDFLSHNYNITYDVLQDYLLNQLDITIEAVARAARNSQSQYYESTSISKWRSDFKRIKAIMEVASLLMQNKHIFFIVQQMKHFDQISTLPAINIEPLLKKHYKLQQQLQDFANTIESLQIRGTFVHIAKYLGRHSRQK